MTDDELLAAVMRRILIRNDSFDMPYAELQLYQKSGGADLRIDGWVSVSEEEVAAIQHAMANK